MTGPTGREKILGAFTPESAPEIGVVASYEGIFIRVHYAELTRMPWWDSTKAPSLAKDFFDASGLEWISVAACASRDERTRQRHERRADGIWLIDPESGKETQLHEPMGKFCGRPPHKWGRSVGRSGTFCGRPTHKCDKTG